MSCYTVTSSTLAALLLAILLGVAAAPATGERKLGTHAGSCGPAGLSGERYRAHSTVEELRHGCLLVRAGTSLFVAGDPGGAVRILDGPVRVEAKCNDETYRDNKGSLSLRVLVLPATPSEGP